MAGRGRRKQNLTLEEQLERTEEEIGQLEKQLDELLARKQEIEDQIAGEKKEALYQAAVQSGRSVEEIITLISAGEGV